MRGHRRIDKLVNRKSFERASDYTIVNLNEDGRIEDWSDSARRVLGYKPAEVKGCSFKIFFNEKENDDRKFGKMIDKAARLGKTSSQTVLVKKDNSTFSAKILINSIYDDEQHLIGFSVIVGEMSPAPNGNGHPLANDHDTSAAELKKLTHEFDMISTSLSHDLRAPLRAIEGYLRIFTEDHAHDLDDEGKRMLFSVRKNSRKMALLIENLVSFSRICTRKLNLSVVNMQELVENVLQELKTGHIGEINLQIEKLPTIIADHSLMNIAFTHLLSNAIKFSSKGQIPFIKISFEKRDQAITFIVKDNGVGFEMEYAGKLFNSFQHLHSESDFEGSGIGLAIVKLVAEKHSGTVWAEAEPNEGATFYLSIPLHE